MSLDLKDFVHVLIIEVGDILGRMVIYDNVFLIKGITIPLISVNAFLQTN